MTWKKERPEDLTETVFRSEATEYKGLSKDIQTVVARLDELREQAQTAVEKNVLFIVNFAEGNIHVTWYDAASSDWTAGEQRLYLDLTPLLHYSESSEVSSNYFAEQVHFALCYTFEEYYVYEHNEATGEEREYMKYRLFAWYEGSSEVQEIIV
jgi:hypothetical protein